MKSVLASFKPQYCELIASGKKTVELRKTRPKLEVPFKVYMYCAKSEPTILKRSFVGKGKPSFDIIPKNDVDCYNQSYNWNGKVIGEFVCDRIDIYKYDKEEIMGRGYWGLYFDELKAACLSFDEALKYGGGKDLYAWHISDLVIYDKPKELGEFYKPCSHDCKNCKYWYSGLPIGYGALCMWEDSVITRPPQSWCYVEEVQG